ncbi:MAG: hypothetical protein VYE77_07295 [Planctomycetota bacterium]|nr:hypothetical protein [Planctomycetota bacterium]
MQFRPTAISLAEIPCATRVPFRFGSVTLEGAPLLHARVELEAVDGRTATGMAADLLVPKWFRKDPNRSVEDDQNDLRRSVEAASASLASDASPRSIFDLWLTTYRDCVQSQSPDADDLLVRGFGTALLERAMIDAACRLTNKSFWSALKSDLFRIRPGELLPELDGLDVAQLLPNRPASSVAVRHTVGMLDPLRDSDISADQRVDDGLPQSLENYLNSDAPRWLKIKIGNGPDQDRQRLLAIAGLCQEFDREIYFTLDGNEQFASLAELGEVLDPLSTEATGKKFLERLAFIEQPLSRSQTFDREGNSGLERVTYFAPLLLDEADMAADSFRRALAQGWRGCSVKNCKGVFRALTNLGLAHQHQDGAFLSAEDLTNLPVLSLQQDLATVAALGLPHVERNGHHYFRGLDHLPADAQDAALVAHQDLYARQAQGLALQITNGDLRLDSLQGPGYGCDSAPFEALETGLTWRRIV